MAAKMKKKENFNQEFKIDENNQNGKVMTKPQPYGCIKISHTHKLGHLFIVEIKFHFKNEKNMLFNEICMSIFEKSKLIKPYERSVPQLLSALSRNERKGYYKYV